ncbi:MAG: DUF2975 domain-containing protein [Bacteroidota bacterium]|nr:DUF2975 domain-containing protein [Bacteroidota bacterium]MDP4215301.1 DUF2975 domain-containing protein [Bacteroidota bacterium]MDP4254871.1 DUF2975 domain-containing protein [Bacteroidota bacterium]MDP4259147.1 DUF2975 domain-containing protein [Bacteroidota bacterium]
MKALGNKSLSAILARVLTVLWWLEWVTFAFVFTFAMVVAGVKKSFTLSIPVNYSAITLRKIIPVNNEFSAGVLNSTSGNLNLTLDSSWQHVALLLTALTTVFTLAIMITFQLKAIFSSFTRNLPFHDANIRRIRNIAFVLIGYSVIQWLLILVVNRVLAANFRWEQVQLTYSFNLSALATGLVLIVIAEIFRLGATLENENKLTI